MQAKIGSAIDLRLIRSPVFQAELIINNQANINIINALIRFVAIRCVYLVFKCILKLKIQNWDTFRSHQLIFLKSKEEKIRIYG